MLDLSHAVEIWPLLASHRSARDSRGGGAGPWGPSGGWASILAPAVEVSTASVHEEVADSGQLEAQLLCNCHLQLFGRSLVFSEDRHQCTSLQVCEDQASTLWSLVSFLLGLLLLLPLTCWGPETEREKERCNWISYIKKVASILNYICNYSLFKELSKRIRLLLTHTVQSVCCSGINILIRSRKILYKYKITTCNGNYCKCLAYLSIFAYNYVYLCQLAGAVESYFRNICKEKPFKKEQTVYHKKYKVLLIVFKSFCIAVNNYRKRL